MEQQGKVALVTGAGQGTGRACALGLAREGADVAVNDLREERARGGRRIVNISSLAGKRMSYFGAADYTASKAGVLGFTRHLAFELARDRITVNAVCPGLTITPLAESAARPGELEMLAQRIPLGRLIRPEHIADAVLFFCSPRAEMVTGTSLDVDGGISLGMQDMDAYFAARRHG